MSKNKYIGECPVCNGCGMLEVVIDVDSLDCSIMCDECLAEWKTPDEALKNINGFRSDFTVKKVRIATIEEIRNAKWEKYIIKD